MRAKAEMGRLWPILVATILAVGIPGCSGVAVAQEATDTVPGPKGVVIEEVGTGSVLETAGLRPGDVVWAWERLPNPPANPEAEHGEIESVFDWMWLEVEQAPRGTMKLFAEQEGVERLFEVAMGKWGGKVRPRLPDRVLEVYLQGREKVEAGEIKQGVELWSQLTKPRDAIGDGQFRSWSLLRIGYAYAETGAWQQALEAYLAALEHAGTPAAEVTIWINIGKSYERRSVLDQAGDSYRAALKIAEANWQGSLYTARIKHLLGAVAWYRGQPELASIRFKEALEIQEKLAPDSLYLALSLNDLANTVGVVGQLELASVYSQRALEIQEKLAPESIEVARSLNSLGIVAFERGQLELASTHYLRALEIQEKLAPESLEVARSLHNLGTVARGRGQLELAGSYIQRALGIQEKLNPDSIDRAVMLNSLGVVANDRGQLESAGTYFQRALEIQQKLAPESLEVARSLNNLGDVAYARGQIELAGTYFQGALEIQEKRAPESLALASVLYNLGLVANARGQLELASTCFQRALEIQEKLAPDSLELARSLNRSGEVTRARGDIDRAADFFQRAIHTLEAQISNLGSSHHIKASFRAQHAELYRNSIETLLQLHRPDDAFASQESSRAKAFLALLTERDLIVSAVPEDLDRERRRLALLYERTQAQLQELNPRDHAEQIDQLTSQLRELRRRYDDNTDKIRRASPAFMALRYPEPLDLEGVRQALDPGTVMLSYSVGEEQTDLFVLTREGPLRVHSLAIGEKTLRSQLVRFERQVQNHGRADPYAQGRFELAKWLFRELIEPASATITASDRLLLVPDGVLHRLPFAALIRETAGRGADEQEGAPERGWQYLVEWKPLHMVLSGTVYAQLRKLRRQPASPRDGETPRVALIAFGDPEYPGSVVPPRSPQGDDTQALARGENGGVADVYVRDATERHDIKPLPYTRTEVETIAGLFGSQPVRTYLGKEATEEHAKALGKDVRIVHFATHGLLNDDFPLNSALALTIPEQFSADRENGLLQVWEIFESVRLDADLVVLSACQTAMGQAQFGEGLIGLSRAFQYAGARSVLATLWSVSDRTTAELMSRFYRHVRSGKTWDEALRAAQLELIVGEVENEWGAAASAPFYWAAFHVIGDWQ